MKFRHIIEYTLLRSNKKNLSLQIKKGELIARAPLQMPKSEIDAFIVKKQYWIQKHLNTQNITKKTYKTGELFLYLGKKYELIIKDCILYFNGTHFIGNATKESFLHLYKRDFADILNRRLPHIAQEHNFSYNQVRIKAQKTRWGSCSAQNNLNFNYLLMMTPLEVIDSVIVHELCHTIHKNHSQQFWKLVYKITPNYRQYHNYLKDNNAIINNIFFS